MSIIWALTSILYHFEHILIHLQAICGWVAWCVCMTIFLRVTWPFHTIYPFIGLFVKYIYVYLYICLFYFPHVVSHNISFAQRAYSVICIICCRYGTNIYICIGIVSVCMLTMTLIVFLHLFQSVYICSF